MSLENISKEELEILSYADITYTYLKEIKKPANTAELFKKICTLLEMSDDDFANKVGDYYTSLVIDKRFKLLESNQWDLSENHIAEQMDHNDDEDEEDFLEETKIEEEIIEDHYEDDDKDEAHLDESELEDNYEDNYEEDFSDEDDENFSGLNIVDEDELEE